MHRKFPGEKIMKMNDDDSIHRSSKRYRINVRPAIFFHFPINQWSIQAKRFDKISARKRAECIAVTNFKERRSSSPYLPTLL